MQTRGWQAFISRVPQPGGRHFGFLLVIALVLGLGMAWVSAYNAHPDEREHVKAADYYTHTQHWLPPKVGDPSARESYSRYGVSYLNEPDIVYLFAGKSGAVLQMFGLKNYHAYRLFNLLLFACLIFIWFRQESSRLALSLLLVSPQVWYIFSYFNADAFPLFLSLLIAHQLAYADSLFNRYLDDNSIGRKLRGALLMGVLLGLLLLSKRNYYLFALFVPFYLVLTRIGPWTAVSLFVVAAVAVLDKYVLPGVFPISRELYFAILVLAVLGTAFAWRHEAGWKTIPKWIWRAAIVAGVVAGVVAAIVLPRISLDLARYGSFQEKSNAQASYAEQVAGDLFKPSRLHRAGESYYGSRLKDKGVSYFDIFLPPWNWLSVSAESSVGRYGYMNVRGPSGYYRVMWGVLVAFLYYIGHVLVVRGDTKTRGLLVLGGVFSLGMIFLSSHHSWVSDFQAQGRYLFPIVAILAVLVGRHRALFGNRVYGSFILGMFALSIFSFALVGLDRIPKG